MLPDYIPQMALSDLVRRQWSAFDQWLSGPRAAMERQREERFTELDKKWRATPTRFRSRREEHEADKMKIRRDLEEGLVLLAREEWQRRLTNAGLRDEDWIDMTLEETRAVERVLGGDLDDDDDDDDEPFIAENVVYAAQTPNNAPNTAPALSNTTRSTNVSGSYAFVSPTTFGVRDVDEDEVFSFDESAFAFEMVTNEEGEDVTINAPAFSTRATEYSRSTQSSHMGSPEKPALRSVATEYPTVTQTRATAPAAPPERPPDINPSKTRVQGPRYIGPQISTPDDMTPEEADFEQFKMETRIAKIREFHNEAAMFDENLARDIYVSRKAQQLGLEEEKRKIAEHEQRMIELRRAKEDQRKIIVEAERQKRREEIRRRAAPSQPAAAKPAQARESLFETQSVSSMQFGGEISAGQRASQAPEPQQKDTEKSTKSVSASSAGQRASQAPEPQQKDTEKSTKPISESPAQSRPSRKEQRRSRGLNPSGANTSKSKNSPEITPKPKPSQDRSSRQLQEPEHLPEAESIPTIVVVEPPSSDPKPSQPPPIRSENHEIWVPASLEANPSPAASGSSKKKKGKQPQAIETPKQSTISPWSSLDDDLMSSMNWLKKQTLAQPWSAETETQGATSSKTTLDQVSASNSSSSTKQKQSPETKPLEASTSQTPPDQIPAPATVSSRKQRQSAEIPTPTAPLPNIVSEQMSSSSNSNRLQLPPPTKRQVAPEIWIPNAGISRSASDLQPPSSNRASKPTFTDGPAASVSRTISDQSLSGPKQTQRSAAPERSEIPEIWIPAAAKPKPTAGLPRKGPDLTSRHPQGHVEKEKPRESRQNTEHARLSRRMSDPPPPSPRDAAFLELSREDVRAASGKRPDVQGILKKAGKQNKTSKPVVTVEEVSDDEAPWSGRKGFDWEDHPSDTNIIMEPKPGVPPKMFSQIFEYEEEGESAPIPSTMADVSRPHASSNDGWFAGEMDDDPKQGQFEWDILLGQSDPKATKAKHVRWTPSALANGSPISFVGSDPVPSTLESFHDSNGPSTAQRNIPRNKTGSLVQTFEGLGESGQSEGKSKGRKKHDAATVDRKGKGREKVAKQDVPDELSWYAMEAIESLKQMRSKPASAV